MTKHQGNYTSLVPDDDGTERKLSLLDDFLKARGINCRKNYELKYATYFKLGGRARYYINPQHVEMFAELLAALKRFSLPYRVIGATSNVVFLDEVDYGIIISTTNLNQLSVDGNYLIAGAGYPLQDLVRVAVIKGSGGFDGLEGIPGTVGGAIFMNAGAYGSCVSECLIRVKCVDEDGNVVNLSKEECQFQHRDSIFRRNGMTILEGVFVLNKGNRKQSYRKIEAIHIARHSYQEYVYPNLGSMITIPSDMYQQIFKHDPLYRVAYMLTKILLKNPAVKFASRRRPRNTVFNWLLKRYLARKLNTQPSYKMSAKSANILINDGTCSILELVDYMSQISSLVGREFRIENEVILKPALRVRSKFAEEYRNLKTLLDGMTIGGT